MAEPTPMPMCPMAEMCKGMMRKRFSGVALVLPGIMLIALGVIIVIEPRIIAWLIAAAFVILGVAMLMMASVVRRVSAQFENMRHEGS